MRDSWREFVGEVRRCDACSAHGVVNILDAVGDEVEAPWGLAWYDRHRNLDGGVMFVAMDFGNVTSVNTQRACLAADPEFVPTLREPGADKTYVRFRRFLTAAEMPAGKTLADHAFVTNAAMCVRPTGAKEGGSYGDGSIYIKCQPHLARQLRLARPAIIVALGREALDAVRRVLGVAPLPDDVGITKLAGKAEEVPWDGRSVLLMPFLHPSYPQDRWGWSDARQQELYQQVAQELATRRETGAGVTPETKSFA